MKRLTCGLLFLGLAVVPTISNACSPPPMEVVKASDVAVIGNGTFSRQSGGGVVAPLKFIKGDRPAAMRVDISYSARKDEPYRGVICPDYELEERQVGTFYLRKLKNGHFNIVSFRSGR